jgi:hypothetical protein
MRKKYDKLNRATDIYEKGLPLITYENLKFLAAYCRKILGYGDKRTEDLVIRYCLDCDENFSEINNAGMLKSALKFSKFQSLEDVKVVDIYKHELDSIEKVKDFRTQVIVISMLVYSKVHYPNSKKFTINIDDLSEIIYLSNVKMTIQTFVENYYFLLKFANISNHKYGNDFFEIKIIKKIGDIAFSITEFKDIRKQYVNFLGKEFFFCKSCGKKSEKNSGSQSYCKECSSNRRKNK